MARIDERRLQQRQSVIATQALRFRTRGLWWDLPSLASTLPLGPTWAPLKDRVYEEFLRALRSGFFGQDRSTRVLWLNAVDPPTEPRLRLRLTPKDAERILEAVGAGEFASRYSSHCWIRIDDAHNWLATWLKPDDHLSWRNRPNIEEALWLAASIKPIRHKPARAMPIASASPAAGARPGVRTTRQAKAQADCERWLRALIANGEQPSKRSAAWSLAEQEFGQNLSKRAFDRVWDSVATAEMKKPGPRGPRSKTPA
jgi:hypothetical protein